MPFETLISSLRANARFRPAKIACGFLEDVGGREVWLSYGELDRRARAIASTLQNHGLGGRHILLTFPAGLEYLVSFLACLYAGVVAVPVYPPRGRRALPRFQAILADAQPALILSTDSIRPMLDRVLGKLPAEERPEVLLSASIPAASAESWRDPGLGAEDLAFLQYTSGSTGSPKGVMLSHGNLVANQQMIQQAFGTDEESVVISWLPPYHDMGLIGAMLHPLFLGARCVLMAPQFFLKQPFRWLRAISLHRGTVSGGPDFSYELCVRQIDSELRESLDLSAWKVAFNGAEPVRPATLDRFAQTFAPQGFSRRAFVPCYGLAEATLMVSAGNSGGEASHRTLEAGALEQGRVVETAEINPEQGVGKVRRVMSCGRISPLLDVCVVDPTSRQRCEAGVVGEIWVEGASVAGGYWGREALSGEVFGARLAEGSQGPFLRTGDLGFVAQGELFVTGRLKDLIILRGRNLYPADLESSAESSHPALGASSSAAFSIEVESLEELVLVLELGYRQRPDSEEVIRAVRQAVGEEFEVQPYEVVLIKPGTLLKTTSGKVQRLACRKDYLADALKVVSRGIEASGGGVKEATRPLTPTEEAVAHRWAEVLGLDPNAVTPEDSFFASGGDSLKGSQLLVRLQEDFGVELGLADFFEAPTVRELAVALEGTSRNGEVEALLPLEPITHGESAPLAAAQERLWFLDRLQPGHPVYNLALELTWRGPLQISALEWSLNTIQRRHEPLRTRFEIASKGPVQVVLPDVMLQVPQVDLSRLPEAVRQRKASDLIRSQARRSFDLGAESPFRALVLRLGECDYRVLLSLHHIASDAWSFGILVRELATLYGACLNGQASPLAKLHIAYADYAVHQRRWLDRGGLEAHMDFWREELADRLPVLEIPADRPRPPVMSFRGAHHVQALPTELGAALRSWSRRHGGSLFVNLLAAFAGFLHRMTGERDFCLGTAIAQRERTELEALIGFFINTLVLRSRGAGAPSYNELRRRMQATLLAAHAHREVPFERLVDELQPERALSHTPLVQVLLVLQNAPLGQVEIPGVELSAREVDQGTARFDLALSFLETEDGLECTWKYSRDLFDEATIRRMANSWQNLLQGMLEDGERSVQALPILSSVERQQVVVEWNDTAAPILSGGLHELCEEQALRTPDAVALTFAKGSLTYREMHRRADGLAADLEALGVGRETVVGVLMERSLELIPALLAILKAEGAYLPLDPAYPHQRLGYMLEDSGAKVLLVQRRFQDLLELGDLPVVLADERIAQGAMKATMERREPVPANALAYVIYTSGSTGKPKGSLIPHRGIVNRLQWMQDAYGLEVGEAVLQKTPTSFDVSVWELFWPLMVGARQVVARPGEHMESALLARRIARERVSTLHFVPSMLQVFLEEPRLDLCQGLTRVVVSGEALPLELEERFRERLGAELHNLYGPTEASVDVTAWPTRARHPRRPPPIGRPISNLRIHLLDEAGRTVPLGVPGELHIGGVGLARGYLRRPGLTAERFVPDATGGASEGGRLYRTGDLARQSTGGEIEYLGRLDHQVKVRGIRIELGEIEAAMEEHPGVLQAVVMVRDGGRLLVAYFMPQTPAPEPEALEAHLRDRLPEAMVPAVFMALETLPKNPAGKVDRKALPEPELGERMTLGPVEPRTSLEVELARRWCEHLNLPQIGVHDNFFELGGDSIRGALFINELQKDLGAVVYVMALFEAPTLEELARYLEENYAEALRGAGWSTVEPATPAKPEETDQGSSLEVMEQELATRFTPFHASEVQQKNPPAVFILSPFRSGSTLLRVMLAGHPELFAPPELELLSFEDLAERRKQFDGRDSFAREGLLRTVMELEGLGPEEAEQWMQVHEEQGLSTRRFYRLLQERIGDRLLVDKTPRYALSPETLKRAERDFEDPLYIHLVRHPGATAHSYVQARMDRVYRLPLEPARQGELLWYLAHRNICSLLAQVPVHRWNRVAFEELVARPAEVMEELSGFLGIEPHDAMLNPYEGARMTDGLVAEGRMMGDPKFHGFAHIEPRVVDRWREAFKAEQFGESTWELAEILGYPREGSTEALGEPKVPLAPQRNQRGDELVLSFEQQRLWFLEQLEGIGPTYNMPAAVRLEGPLRRDLLARTFAKVEHRHESLRTTFPARGGRAQQSIHGAHPLMLPRIDLKALPEEKREREAERLTAVEARRRFDLAQGPLFRRFLVELEEERALLLVVLHHIVADGWSIGILVREIAALYGALCRNRPSPLPEPSVQYADFAHWQRRWLESGALERDLAYWKERLAGSPPVLELPMDRPRPPLQSHRGGQRPFTLPSSLVRRLRKRAQGRGATLFNGLLAAWKALLVRYGSSTDVVIGTPVANRNRAEVEGLIGLFVNTLVLRTDLSGNPGFDELVERVHGVSAEALAHQELPFGKLVEELAEQRDLSRSPLFQVLVVLQNTPAETLRLPELDFEILPIDNHTAKFDLSLLLTETGEGLSGYLEYSVDLFDGTTLDRCARHFEALMEGMVANPRVGLLELPLISEAERHQALWEWNDTAVERASVTLEELFEAQASRTPEAIATVFEGQWSSYGALRSRRDEVAHTLEHLGVGPEVLVGLLMERSAEMVVALLAVLRAGGAYVPLDPSYPQERLLTMLAEIDGPVLLTQRHLASRLGRLNLATVVVDERGVESQRTLVSTRTHEVNNLAYTIYTSGSTGRPKGSQLAHRGIVNRLLWMKESYGLGAGDAVIQKTPFSFDVSVWEFFWPLITGARLVIAKPEGHRDGAYLRRLVLGERVTAMHFVPSMLELFLEQPDLAQCRSLRWVIASGEALTPELRDRFFARCPGQLHNLYGPTEASVEVTSQICVPGGRTVPIGRPIANLSAHVVDRRGRTLPRGVAGELLIGGVALARGYLGRPGLSAERFIPDPFGDQPGGRLYRTGDLVRRRTDGAIDFLGRIDFQVKLRGFRIELGEIEALLTQHPGLRRSVVVLREDRPGDFRLVAYVVPDGQDPPHVDELRLTLREHLPEHMVPSFFVFSAELPLTGSGKVDRRALPPPLPVESEAVEVVLPQNDIERLIARIWQEVLGLERVGIHENFFDLGGHSLLAAEVHGRLQEELHRELSVVELFRHPTIHALSDHLGGGVEQGVEEIYEAARKEKAALRRRRARRKKKAQYA